jgi:hypothetical protein
VLWSEFNTAVRNFLPAHGRRQGIQTFIDTLIKAGVADVQQSVEFYQTGHQDIIGPDLVTTDGYASIGDLPAGQIQTARMAKYDPEAELLRRGIYLGLKQIGWENNLRMRGGELAAYVGRIAIDRVNRKYCVVPAINANSRLVLEWNGVKRDFGNDDETPFDDDVAEAVADFVLSRVSRQIDRDLNLANSYAGSYVLKKRKLVSEALERSRVAKFSGSQLDGDDSLSTDVGVVVITSDTFMFQPTITDYLGSGGNTLQSRPQNTVTTGTVWMIIVNDRSSTWRLTEIDQASNVDSGYVRPDDFNGRTWVRVL